MLTATVALAAVLAATAAGAARETVPRLSVDRHGGALSTGYVFVAPKGLLATSGLEIADDRGRPVWWYAFPHGEQGTDFRVQTYHGEPVLTWWQGTGFGGQSDGVDYIADSSYHVIANVKAGNGLDTDGHEFLLTPAGTALILSYHQVPYDLSSLGGPKNGDVIEGVIQEIDVATGAVVFEWHSLDQVPITESYVPMASPYDYFHINSVEPESDGTLLISARHTSTIYDIDRATGRILWRLGGKRSDFTLGPGVALTGQHDARAAGPDTIRLFDNGDDQTAPNPRREPESRVEWIHLDAVAKTATLVRAVTHPSSISATSEGNAQALDNGDTFVDWGDQRGVSEFDPRGGLLFDATIVGGASYRGYRFGWSGQPDTGPTATARRGRRSTTVDAIWNGATAVARWRILAGATAKKLATVATVSWNGLDTRATIRRTPKLVRVAALDSTGTVLAESATVRVR